MPKVSVILAVYNVAPYLHRSLDCLINQTLKDIEIICIDDCSTDNSFEILKEYAKKDNRIIIGKSPQNRGAAFVRNIGLKAAKGEYLGFIDPDDAVDLNYFETLYNSAKEKNVDVVKCGIKSVYPDGREEIGHLNDEIKENNISYLFNYEWTTAIYKTDFIKENNITFPEECKKAQDDVFLARVIFKHALLEVIDGVFYYYYRREGSLDSSNIPLQSIKSALISTGLVLKEINSSNLNKSQPDLYIKLYNRRLCAIFRNLFQNDMYEAQCMCAEALVKYYFQCLDVEALKKEFSYKWLLKFIENKDVTKLADFLLKYKNINDLRKPLTRYQKILSVRNSSDGEHKEFYFMGIKFLIKRKKK